jgi:hypothetical protein
MLTIEAIMSQSSTPGDLLSLNLAHSLANTTAVVTMNMAMMPAGAPQSLVSGLT